MSAAPPLNPFFDRLHRLVLVVVAGLAMIAAGHGAFMLAFELGGPHEPLLATTGALILCFGTIAACTAVLRRAPRWGGPMSLLAIVLAVAGTALLICLAWAESAITVTTEEFIAKAGTTLVGLAIAIAHTGVFRLVPARSRLVAATKWTTTAGMWTLLAAVMVVAWWGEALFRIDFATAIAIIIGMLTVGVLVIAGTIVAPLAALSQANKAGRASESIARDAKLRLECPRCGRRQLLRTGHVRCQGCGVGLFIELEEPRCECGYLLYRLQGDTCPECGRALTLQPALTTAAGEL